MIALWKGKNPIYFGVFTIIPFDHLYRREYFVMHDLWPNDPKINRVLPLPQGIHVAKFGKDPIYRTKVIVRKPVWTSAHPPAIPNHIIRPISRRAHKKHTYFTKEISLKFVDTNFRGLRKNCIFMDLLLGHPHRFLHNNFSSVYRIFTKLGHMNPLWKGKNSIYFGVIRSKVKVTITINRIVDNRIVSAW
jgi:hypothetical protein